MPFAIFFVTLLVSVSLSLSTFQVFREAQRNVGHEQSASAFVLAESTVRESSSVNAPQQGTDLLRARDFIELADLDLELNQGVPVHLAQQTFTSAAEPAFPTDVQSEMQLSFFDLMANEMFDSLVVEYCALDEVCPELMVDWIRLDPSFQFQQLSGLDPDRFDQDVEDHCVDLPLVGIQRCAVRSSELFAPAGIEFDSAESEAFQQVFRLRLFFPSYHYVVRFRSLDRQPFSFQMHGQKGAEKVPVPHVQSLESVGHSSSFLRKVSEQKIFSAGLQDGLGFVHYAHRVENK